MVPTTPTPMTISIRARRPDRNSTSSLRAASLDSLGSSAAWTAWNMNSGIRAIKTPYENCVTSSASSSSASRVAATTPALRSAAPKTEPMSSQPRFGVTSFQLDSGPGDVLRCPRAATRPTAKSGASPTASPYGPAAVMPMAASTRQSTMRTTPSDPMMTA